MQIYSFQNVPHELYADQFSYADTSFVYELFGDTMSSRQMECRFFLGQAAIYKSPIVFSTIAREELRSAAQQEIAAKHAPALGYHPGRDRKKIISNTPNFMAQCDDLASRIEELINSNSNFLPFPVTDYDSLINAIGQHMREENLSPKDARHYEVMKSEGINVILTLDGDYANIKDPDFIVITDSQNYNKLKNGS